MAQLGSAKASGLAERRLWNAGGPATCSRNACPVPSRAIVLLQKQKTDYCNISNISLQIETMLYVAKRQLNLVGCVGAALLNSGLLISWMHSL